MKSLQLNRKILFKVVGLAALTALFFSCRGLSVNGLAPMVLHPAESHAESHTVGCCDSMGKATGANTTHHDIKWSTGAHKNIINFFGVISSVFAGIVILRLPSVRRNGFLYVRAIRDRYGGFSVLNYFAGLFSRGILHPKIY